MKKFKICIKKFLKLLFILVILFLIAFMCFGNDIINFFTNHSTEEILFFAVFIIIGLFCAIHTDSSADRSYTYKELYNTDLATGKMIDEAVKLSEKQGKKASDVLGNADKNAYLYNTDLGKGALISALDSLNKKEEK